jgi:hypothetical protein
MADSSAPIPSHNLKSVPQKIENKSAAIHASVKTVALACLMTMTVPNTPSLEKCPHSQGSRGRDMMVMIMTIHGLKNNNQITKRRNDLGGGAGNYHWVVIGAVVGGVEKERGG